MSPQKWHADHCCFTVGSLNTAECIACCKQPLFWQQSSTPHTCPLKTLAHLRDQLVISAEGHTIALHSWPYAEDEQSSIMLKRAFFWGFGAPPRIPPLGRSLRSKVQEPPRRGTASGPRISFRSRSKWWWSGWVDRQKKTITQQKRKDRWR